MDWAKNSLNEIVHAQRGVYIGYGMTCPTCGEAVYLKPGQKRRPHFAHYSNRANPDCEYYYPSQDALKSSISRSPIINPSLYPRHESLRCGLFLVYLPETSGFELSLRIPSIESFKQMNGSLEIQLTTGVKNFTSAQLIKAYSVKLSPTVPLLECEGIGDLLPLSEHIRDQASSFIEGMNLFAVSEGRGRFLFPSESLEWGGRYWIVTAEPIIPPKRVTALVEWNRLGSLDNWQVYEVELRSTFIASRFNLEKEALSEFFGRIIRTRQPRAYIVFPLPHHLSSDGAYVYPYPPEILYVRRTSDYEVTVEGSPELVSTVGITSLTGDLVQIKGIQPSSQDLVILIKGIEQVVVRTETCDLIQPGRLRAYIDELNWDLLVDTALSREELYSQEIKLECGSDRLAQYVAKINKDWILNGNVVVLPKNTDKALSIGGFGEIRPVTPELESSEGHETTYRGHGALSPKVTWIVNLIRKRYDPQTATVSLNFVENPSKNNMKKLGSISTGQLMPYLRASTEPQQKRGSTKRGLPRN